jgi:two-component system, NtrC family, sensor kinase
MNSNAMPSQRVQQILWALPDPLMVLNHTLQVEYINSALEKMLGVSLKQVQGKSIHEIELEIGNDWKNLIQKLKDFSNGDLANHKRMSLEDNKTRELLNDPLMPKNSLGPYQDRPKINLNEKIYFYEIFKVYDPKDLTSPLSVVLFREITRDIEINDQMVQAEKMSGLGTLAAGLAHELNNPLYTIIGFSEMILKENDKIKIDVIAKRIRERSQNSVKILESLNSYIQSNPIDGHMTVNINERLDAALEIALLTHESKNIAITKNYSTLPFFKAKSDEIQQIFFNIFANSIQAMSGIGELIIRSTNIDKGKGIVVAIQDTGKGVPKEYIAKVFDPFFTTKDQGEGTGLGLTAAYQLVKKYGGRIKFNSIQGEGTTVEIYWPVKDGATH